MSRPVSGKGVRPSPETVSLRRPDIAEPATPGRRLRSMPDTLRKSKNAGVHAGRRPLFREAPVPARSPLRPPHPSLILP